MIQQRQIANREILDILNKLVEKYPDLRFNQLLQGFNIIVPSILPTGYIRDEYNMESVVLLERIKETVEKIG